MRTSMFNLCTVCLLIDTLLISLLFYNFHSYRKTSKKSRDLLPQQSPQHISFLPEPEQYLCTHWLGRLGNLMFQYASIYGIAKTRNLKVGFTATKDLHEIFHLSTNPLTDPTLCLQAEKVWELHHCAYDNRTVYFKKRERKNYVMISSYLQSWKYFQNVENDIRKQFRFRDDIVEKATKVLENAARASLKQVPRKTTIVGIHVRRGDNVLASKIAYGYQMATKEYIDKAMKHFRDKFNNLIFVVFTNPNERDYTWCRDNVQGDDVRFIRGNSKEVDLCAISMCNHTIMTIGTFGWWGSFLANGTTVYFKDVARNGSKLRKDFSQDMTDYFYPGWIGL